MMPTTRAIRKKRVYSEDFKRELVRLFERGKFSVLQLSRLYGVRFSVIYRWIYKYSQFNEPGYRVIEMKESSTNKLKAMEQRIKDLEKIVGQKQIKIDFLEEMINVAQQELNVDIKKKSSTPRSGGSMKEKKS
jgi:transposase-like protein